MTLGFGDLRVAGEGQLDLSTLIAVLAVPDGVPHGRAHVGVTEHRRMAEIACPRDHTIVPNVAGVVHRVDGYACSPRHCDGTRPHAPSSSTLPDSGWAKGSGEYIGAGPFATTANILSGTDTVPVHGLEPGQALVGDALLGLGSSCAKASTSRSARRRTT